MFFVYLFMNIIYMGYAVIGDSLIKYPVLGVFYDVIFDMIEMVQPDRGGWRE